MRRVGAVILAAGSSSRLGRPKQLIHYEGQPLILRTALAARRAGVDSVIVVVGAFSKVVSEAVIGVGGLTLVSNKGWRSGLSSSLSAGLATAKSIGLDGAMILTADQPMIGVASLEKLLEQFDEDQRVVAAAYDGIVGVPAIFGHEHFDALMNLNGDEGAGRWLRSNPDAVKEVPIPEAAVDIDTLADVARLQALVTRD